MDERISKLDELQLVNVDVVASMFGITRGVVYRWAQSGKIPQPIRIGRCLRWSVADLDKFLDKKRE